MRFNRNVTRREVLRTAFGTAGAAAIGLRPFGSVAATLRSQQAIKLVNVEHDSRPLDNAAYAAVYEVFKQRNPEIEIEFQIIPWEQARAKMLTLGQGDSLPDVGRMQWPSDYAAANMVVPLDGMVDAATLARFDPIIIDQASAIGNDGQKHL